MGQSVEKRDIWCHNLVSPWFTNVLMGIQEAGAYALRREPCSERYLNLLPQVTKRTRTPKPVPGVFSHQEHTQVWPLSRRKRIAVLASNVWSLYSCKKLKKKKKSLEEKREYSKPDHFYGNNNSFCTECISGSIWPCKWWCGLLQSSILLSQPQPTPACLGRVRFFRRKLASLN